jgi:hypothetical protein
MPVPTHVISVFLPSHLSVGIKLETSGATRSENLNVRG